MKPAEGVHTQRGPAPAVISAAGWRSTLLRSLLGLSCLLQVSGCASLGRGTPAMPVARTVQDLVPHGDRDHFVYVWHRIEDGQVVGDGIQVEHVTAGENGEFEVTTSENGMASGRMRVRDLGDRLMLVFEEDVARGVRISYEPPLPQIQVPLLPGRYAASASATITRAADGVTLGVVPVTQVIDVEPGPAVKSLVGTFAHSVVLRLVRTLQSPEVAEELKTDTVLVPGIGETSSTGNAPGTPQMRRELACAIIGGRRLGDCSDLGKAWRGRGDR